MFCQHKIDTRRRSYLSRVKFTRCLLFEHRSRSAQSSPACLGSQLSLGSRSSTYLLVNVYTHIHTHTRDIDGYRCTSPKFYGQNPETRRNSALGTPQILKYFHWKIPSKDRLIKVLLRVSWLADRFRWFDDKQRQPCYRIPRRFSIKQREFRSLKV